ncbi:MAG: HD domain-containing protein [Nitrospirae bacterium]|nr:HD domain-containing protein [Nitrospirota bacterium]
MVIKTKIITIIALTIMLTIGATTVVLIRAQNVKMIDDKLKDAEFLCDLVESTTDSAMKEGNNSEVQRILENLGKNNEILQLRILSSDGTILKSSKREEIGVKSADFIKSSSSESFQRPTLLNENTITYYHAIPNRQECHGCHSKSSPINGIIHLQYDISRNVATFLSIKRLLIFSNIGIVVLISVILSTLFSKLVLNPLRKLLDTIHAVEEGNWQAAVNINGNDELGVLGKSFNTMIQKINALYQKNLVKERELSRVRVDLENKGRFEDLNKQLEFKIKELETANKAITSLSKEVRSKNTKLEKAVERLKKINEVGRVLSSIIETQELMHIIIQTTADLLRAEKVTMHLNNSERPELTIQYVRGIGIRKINDFCMELNEDASELYTHGRPVLRTLDSSGLSGFESRSRISRVAVPLRMNGQIIGAMMIENDSDIGIFTEEELELLTTLSNQAMVALENAWLYERVKGSYFSTIQSLVNALEANDKFTRGHSERVRLLSVELGMHIGLDIKELELLEHAAILHDIGKIGIDNFILQKNGKLSSKEYSIIKTHPLIGDEILGPIGTMDIVRKTIIQHHERYDGNGYPFGLRGDEISLKSRVLSVVDTFDAMMTDRPYRKALTLYEVKTELETNAGSQFDPFVVRAFVDLLSQDENRLLALAGYGNFCPS